MSQVGTWVLAVDGRFYEEPTLGVFAYPLKKVKSTCILDRHAQLLGSRFNHRLYVTGFLASPREKAP